jgi:hypothetical protein
MNTYCVDDSNFDEECFDDENIDKGKVSGQDSGKSEETSSKTRQINKSGKGRILKRCGKKSGGLEKKRSGSSKGVNKRGDGKGGGPSKGVNKRKSSKSKGPGKGGGPGKSVNKRGGGKNGGSSKYSGKKGYKTLRK